MNHIHLIGRFGADPSVTPYRNDKQPKDTEDEAALRRAFAGIEAAPVARARR